MGTGQKAVGKIKAIRLIGYEGQLTWSRTQTGLTIPNLPTRAPGQFAFVFELKTEGLR